MVQKTLMDQKNLNKIFAFENGSEPHPDNTSKSKSIQNENFEIELDGNVQHHENNDLQ